MIDLTDSVCLGTITKTHGIKGQVIVKLDRLSSDDIQKMEWVFIEIDGLPVPFFIEEYEEKTTDKFILTLEDIVTEENALELVENKVFINKKDIRPNTISENIDHLSQIIGYTVIDTVRGEIGILKDILDIEMNPLLKIVNKKKEILLPIQTEFITAVDPKNKVISVTTPKGLIDLF